MTAAMKQFCPLWRNLQPRFAVAVTLLTVALRGMALAGETEHSAPPDPVPAFQAELQKVNDAVTAKLDAVAEVIKEEEAARRLKRDVAEEVRGKIAAFRKSMLTGAKLAGLGTPSGVSNEPAVAKAWNELGDAVAERRQFLEKKSPVTLEAAVQYAVAIWKNARSEKDLAPGLEDLAALEVFFDRFPSYERPGATRALLEKSQAFLSALKADEHSVLGSRSVELRHVFMGRNPPVSPADIEKWMQRFVGPLEEELQQARARMNDLLLKHAGFKDSADLADRIDALSARLRTINMGKSDYARFNQPNFFRTWSAFLRDVETAQWTLAEKEMKNIHLPNGPEFTPEARQAFAAQFSQLKKRIADSALASQTAAETRVIERLAEISDADSAFALADALAAQRTAAESSEKEEDAMFEADLRQVAAIWKGAPVHPGGQPFSQPSRASIAWMKAVRILRDRALQEVIARSVPAPELLQPPLNGLPPGEAVRRLGRDLSGKRDYPRLQALLSQSTQKGASVDHDEEIDELRALKSFLTAGNFERAEQFEDAVRIYREVLVCVGELVPVEETIARLKILPQSHPEALPKRGTDPAPQAKPSAPEGAPASKQWNPGDATLEHPFTNSLGMAFVPVKIEGGPTDSITNGSNKVLFAQTVTTVAQYEEFAQATHRKWPKPGFAQQDDHPAVEVTYNDATEFCEWLTGVERQSGKLPDDARYRLPTDHEWSSAVGIAAQEDVGSSPRQKHDKLKVFPWGTSWPPPLGSGNYADESAREAHAPTFGIIQGYRDNYPYTSPVRALHPNEQGLSDMSGNVFQWCADRYIGNERADEGAEMQVARGSSWRSNVNVALWSAARRPAYRSFHDDATGFRCVMETDLK
ncbi:MAG: eukaryotic-like serine/threonine-protein kinase [Chthoniobacter sp.]|jgi:hypothetical protein|nr:eukaryotic-like serine/threonine-protein kinase [Chthoniobacter sp.]